jgi:hypothetical protein
LPFWGNILKCCSACRDAAAVSKNLGAYRDASLRDPVIIIQDGRPRTVLIAQEDYQRLTQRDRKVELTSTHDCDLAGVEFSELGGDRDDLDAELLTKKHAGDWTETQ